MELNKNNIKKILLIITFAIVLFLALDNYGVVFSVAGRLISYVSAFLVGLAVAFILNVPLNFIEARILSGWKKKSPKTYKRFGRAAAIVLTLGFVCGIVFITLFLLIPQLGNTFETLVDNAPRYLRTVQQWLDEHVGKYEIDIASWVNWEKISGYLDNLEMDFEGLFTSTIGVTTSIFSGLVNFVMGIVFSVYILFQKERLASQANRMMSAFLPKKISNKITSVASLSHKMFSRFVSGQFLEAVILGVLCFIGMSILRLPYASMIAVLTAFCALIPIFGAFISAIIGGFLILMVSPIKALWFVIFIIVLQQLEGDLIYPKVVGSTIGLPSIWVLLAVLVGGNIGGIFGMLVSVPLCAVVYCLVRDAVNARNEGKAPPEEAESEEAVR